MLGWKGDKVEDMFFDEYQNPENMYVGVGKKKSTGVVDKVKQMVKAPQARSPQELSARAQVNMAPVKYPTPIPKPMPTA